MRRGAGRRGDKVATIRGREVREVAAAFARAVAGLSSPPTVSVQQGSAGPASAAAAKRGEGRLAFGGRS